MISRLDEDLSTLGQISKLSETLSFPHQVLWTKTHMQTAAACFSITVFVLTLPALYLYLALCTQEEVVR